MNAEEHASADAAAAVYAGRTVITDVRATKGRMRAEISSGYCLCHSVRAQYLHKQRKVL